MPLEAWLVPQVNARGTVILFHGHAASKDSQLREASVFHGMGFNAFLVDFYGSGGSGGNETSRTDCMPPATSFAAPIPKFPASSSSNGTTIRRRHSRTPST